MNRARGTASSGVKLALACSLLAALSAPARAALVTITTDDGRIARFGWNFQPWAQFAEGQSPDGRHYNTDFLLRRSRVYLNGQLSERLLFNYQLRIDNDGRTADASAAPERPQHEEAFLTAVYDDRARLSFGLVKIPFARQNLEGAFSQLLIDKDFVRGKTQIQRSEYDFGGVAWGSVGSARVKYYAAVMDGRHGGPNTADRPRLAGRLELHALEPDAPTSYEPAGTYLGKRRALALGAAYDYAPDAFLIGSTTSSYRAWTVDVFFEHPVGAAAWTFEGGFLRFDHGAGRGSQAPADQGYGLYAQAGVLLPGAYRGWRLQPVLRLSGFNSDRSAAGADERRLSLGLNHYWKEHDAKIQLDATRIEFAPPHQSNPAQRDYWQFTLGAQIKT